MKNHRKMFVRSNAEAEKQLVDLTMKRKKFMVKSWTCLPTKTWTQKTIPPSFLGKCRQKTCWIFVFFSWEKHTVHQKMQKKQNCRRIFSETFWFSTPDASAATGVLQLSHPLGGPSRHLHSPGAKVTVPWGYSPEKDGNRLEKAHKCQLNFLTLILCFDKICCIIIFCWQLEMIWRVPTLYSSSDRNGKEEIAKAQFNSTVRIFMARLGCTNNKATNGKDSPQHEQKSHTFRPQNTSFIVD